MANVKGPVAHRKELHFKPADAARLMGRTPNLLHVHITRAKIKTTEVPVPQRMVPFSEIVRELREEGRDSEAKALERKYATQLAAARAPKKAR